MLNRIEELMQRFDALTLRERVLVFGATVALVFVVWQFFMMDPLADREQAARRELGAVEERIKSINRALAATAARIDDPARTDARAQAERLRLQMDGLNAELEGYLENLIAPEDMAEVLEDVLVRQGRLRLVSMRNLPVEPLAEREDPEMSGDDVGLYKHGLEITLEGRYLDCLAYLDELEELPWRIYWEVFDLQSEQHPKNTILLRVHTLSLAEEWMGV